MIQVQKERPYVLGRSRNALTLRITLAESDPPIWRRVAVPGKSTLHELHRTIQLIYSWLDYHLYEFRIGDQVYQAPDEESGGHDSTKARLKVLGLRPGDRFEYVYDFGDAWTHNILVEDAEPFIEDDDLPIVIDGARAGPPEDSGGIHAYQRLLDALSRVAKGQEVDDDELEQVEWVGSDFDPADFSVSVARHALMLTAAWGTLKHKR